MTLRSIDTRLDDDGARDASRGVAVACSLGCSTTSTSSIDLLDGHVDGPLNDPRRTAASFNGSDPAIAATATPLSRCVLSP
jgi:hypothetical protein